MPFAATWMQLDYHTKWSKSERERQIPYDVTYTWNLKYDTNEPIHEIETDSHIEDRLMIAKGQWGKGGKDWEFVISDVNYYI